MDALFCAKLCCAAQAPDCQNWFKEMGLETQRIHYHNPHYDTECWIARKDRDGYVIFQGSADVQDWVRNFDVKLVAHEAVPGLIAAGISDEVQECWYEIIRDTRKICKDTKLTVTGFSRGGALAQVMAYVLHHHRAHYFKVADVQAFAAPRVGNGEFALAAHPWSLQIWANRLDPVPNVPPVGKYGHAAELTVLPIGRKAAPSLLGIGEHDIELYADRIQEAAKP
jgi:hypothetical protein